MIRFASLLLGIWLLATSTFFDYGSDALQQSDRACGILILLLGLAFRSQKSPLRAWSLALIGVWLGFAPLVLWAPNPACYLNDTLSGAAALALFILSGTVMPHQAPDIGPSVPPGWSYNPSSWPQRLPIAFLAFCCWMISRYLSAYQLGYIHSVWDPFFPDGTLHVITSDVSKDFPVSDAGLGALAYSIEFLSALKGGERRWRTMPWMVILFGLLAVPLSLVSILLIILQPTVVGAWCSLCLFNALLMLILMTLSIDEVIAAIQYLRCSNEKPFFQLLIQGGTCPGAKTDTRTPLLNAPIWSIIRASFWGVQFCWTLLLSAIAGFGLLFLPGTLGFEGPIGDVDHTIGALVVVASVFSCAQVARSLRFLNLLFGAALGGASLLYSASHLPIHLAIAVVLILLSLPKGKKTESTEICKKSLCKF